MRRSPLSSLALAAAALLAALALLPAAVLAARDPADCEVCLAALGDVVAKLPQPAPKLSLVAIEEAVGAYCEKPPTEKHAKLCYYIDPIKRELSTPLKNGAPVSVVCQKLKKKSAEICSLKFASSAPAALKIDAATDFTKLKVAQLKAFIAEKNIPCASCLEKDDFVAHIKAAIAAKGGEL
jgi:hypothetical protein